MADLFISYSRKDGDFVRSLNDALAAVQREVWVDWEDIPASAEWLAEIEGADEVDAMRADSLTPTNAPSMFSTAAEVPFAVIDRPQQERLRATPGFAGAAQPPRIDVPQRGDEIQRPDAVPELEGQHVGIVMLQLG